MSTPGSARGFRYQPPWLWIAVSLVGYLETRMPPHIWLDGVILALSAVLAFGVVLHAVCWFGTCLWVGRRD